MSSSTKTKKNHRLVAVKKIQTAIRNKKEKRQTRDLFDETKKKMGIKNLAALQLLFENMIKGRKYSVYTNKGNLLILKNTGDSIQYYNNDDPGTKINWRRFSLIQQPIITKSNIIVWICNQTNKTIYGSYRDVPTLH